jgi:hypothetical protein
MFKRAFFSLALVTTLLISACGLLPTFGSNPTPKAADTLAPVPLPTLALPTVAVAPTLAPVPLPTVAVVTPTTSAPAGSLPDISTANYLDDRSTPVSVLLSYYNAINKHEYLRAYSYWNNPSVSQGTLEQFTNGYLDTASVSLMFGKVSDEGAAGSIYFTVPVIINAVKTNSTQQKFAACYILRLPQPGNYGAPPISPMGMEKGTAKVVALNTTDANALAQACTGPDYGIGPNISDPVVESIADLSSGNYIDNRSASIELVSSYFNAFNSKQIVRAYSYWETPAPFVTFSANYANWEQVTATFGTAASDAGAGQYYYTLPLSIKVQLTGGSLKTYIGCYTLHLSSPGIQGVPPFRPLAIKDEKLTQVDNNADVTPLLATACN